MAKIVNFPHFLDDKIRIKGATKWISSESKMYFTAGQEYPLLFNEDEENEKEWYVLDDLGNENYAFHELNGDFK